MVAREETAERRRTVVDEREWREAPARCCGGGGEGFQEQPCATLPGSRVDSLPTHSRQFRPLPTRPTFSTGETGKRQTVKDLFLVDANFRFIIEPTDILG